MRAFGGFRLGDRFLYGEIAGEVVHVLANPFWNDTQPTGEIVRLADVIVDVPVAPWKLIAVGLNYTAHIRDEHHVTAMPFVAEFFATIFPAVPVFF